MIYDSHVLERVRIDTDFGGLFFNGVRELFFSEIYRLDLKMVISNNIFPHLTKWGSRSKVTFSGSIFGLCVCVCVII